MNKGTIRSGFKVAKTALIVSALMIIVGIVIGGIGLLQANLDGNFSQLSAYQIHEHNLGYFNAGEDMQLVIGGTYTNKIDNRLDRTYKDNFLEIVVLFSTQQNFSDLEKVYQVESSGLYRDFSSKGGYYKVIVTSLSVHQIKYFLVESQFSTSTLVVMFIGLVLTSLGMAIVSMITWIVLIVILILGIESLIKILKENE